jgi:hypothetical protein
MRRFGMMRGRRLRRGAGSDWVVEGSAAGSGSRLSMTELISDMDITGQ